MGSDWKLKGKLSVVGIYIVLHVPPESSVLYINDFPLMKGKLLKMFLAGRMVRGSGVVKISSALL